LVSVRVMPGLDEAGSVKLGRFDVPSFACVGTSRVSKSLGLLCGLATSASKWLCGLDMEVRVIWYVLMNRDILDLSSVGDSSVVDIPKPRAMKSPTLPAVDGGS
jgi:hypothetical protein